MSILNEKGELSKGFEILARQILKMLNINGDEVLSQIQQISDNLRGWRQAQEAQAASIRENNAMLKALLKAQGISDVRSEQSEHDAVHAAAHGTVNGKRNPLAS